MRMPVGFRANLRNSACRSGDERDFDARALCHCVLRTGGNSTAVPSHAGVAASWLGGHAGLGPRTPADAFGSSADRPHCSCADIPDDRTPLHIPRSASTTWPPSLALRLSMFATQTTCETSNSRRGFLGRPGFPVLSRGELAAWGGEGIAEVAIVRWCVFMLADAVGRARRPSDTLVLYWKSFGFVRAALSYPLGTVGTSTN